jgi:hypothetical protein
VSYQGQRGGAAEASALSPPFSHPPAARGSTLIERFFVEITRKRIRRSFRRARTPTDAINDYIAHHNEDPHRSSGPAAHLAYANDAYGELVTVYAREARG